MMVAAESGSRLAGDRCRLRDETGEARANRRKRDRRVEVVMPMCGMDVDGGKQWIAVKMDVDDGGADRATTPVLPRQKSESVGARGAPPEAAQPETVRLRAVVERV